MKAIIAFFLLTFVLGSLSQSQQTLVLTGTAYDFSNWGIGTNSNSDFNHYLCGLQKGMVEDTLGPNNVPVLKDGKSCVTSADSFSHWFTPYDGPGANIPIEITLTFVWNEAAKAYNYRNNNFFPLDNQGYGYEGMPHNYGFCFALNTQFTYMRELNQIFDFTGDDDVWVYINKKLAIDLGGVHGASSDSVSLNSLNLIDGNTYPLDFFFCERHQSESNLVISTTIKLDPCGTMDTDGDSIPDLCDACPKGDMGLDVWADEQIGPNNGVTFHCALTSPTTGVTVRVNYGDEAFETTGDPSGITGWVSFDSITGQMDITHNYEKPGTYTVIFEASNESGCGNQGRGEVEVTVGGKRLAPKCSEFDVVPGQSGIAKRKRSL